ncbi:MAG: hypothetical protein QOI66_262 [Myxococcales bacterium]|jgi:hypothetical protein|nr:hypothetical protein [Myxococcales bacterium]
MQRAVTVYFVALCTAAALFWAGAHVATGWDQEGSFELVRFLVLAAGGAAAVTTWVAAVTMASVHRVAWPLAVAALIVVCAAGTFFATSRRASIASQPAPSSASLPDVSPPNQ